MAAAAAPYTAQRPQAVRKMTVPLPSLRALIEDGDNSYVRKAERIVDGQEKLVLVGVGFTIKGEDHEKVDFRGFEARMDHFANELREKMQLRVTVLECQRREGKPPWAHFEVTMPEFHFEIPTSPATLKSHNLDTD